MSTQDDTNTRIFEKLDALTAIVTDLRVEIVEVKTELRLRKECPEPGACIALAKTVTEHERTINQAKGGWKLITGAVISSGLLGGLITNWLSKN